MVEPRSLGRLSALRERTLLLVGASGFIGKVVLRQLLVHGPADCKIICLLRASDAAHAEARLRRVFEAEIFSGVPHEHVVAWAGDLGDPQLSLPVADLIVNCAGEVRFDHRLDALLAVNVHGPLALLAHAQRHRAALCHVSTAFVAAPGVAFVTEHLPTTAPNGVAFDAEAELAEVTSLLTQGDGTKKSDRAAAAQFVALGRARSQAWGWPNAYAYSKALAEHLLWGRRGDAAVSFLRPSIVEAAAAPPLTGWLEGANTLAPLALLLWRGQRHIPLSPDLLLDVIPVDAVANATLVVAAATLAGEASGAYQACSSDRNPLSGHEVLRWLGEAVERRRASEEPSPTEQRVRTLQGVLPAQQAAWVLRRVRDTMRRFDAQPPEHIASQVSGWLGAAAKVLTRHAEPVQPRAESLLPAVQGAQRAVAVLEPNVQSWLRQAELASAVIDTLRPFAERPAQRFSTERLRSLFDGAPDDLSFAPEALDWRSYLLDVEAPALFQRAFPILGADAPRVDTQGVVNIQAWTMAHPNDGSVAFADSRERHTYSQLAKQTSSGRAIDGALSVSSLLAALAAWREGQRVVVERDKVRVEAGSDALLIRRRGGDVALSHAQLLSAAAAASEILPIGSSDLVWLSPDSSRRFAGIALGLVALLRKASLVLPVHPTEPAPAHASVWLCSAAEGESLARQFGQRQASHPLPPKPRRLICASALSESARRVLAKNGIATGVAYTSLAAHGVLAYSADQALGRLRSDLERSLYPLDAQVSRLLIRERKSGLAWRESGLTISQLEGGVQRVGSERKAPEGLALRYTGCAYVADLRVAREPATQRLQAVVRPLRRAFPELSRQEIEQRIDAYLRRVAAGLNVDERVLDVAFEE